MVTFPLPTADVAGTSIRYCGSWVFGAVGGHNTALVQGGGSQIDTRITLTTGTNTIRMTVFGGSTQPFDVYLDGALQTRPTLSSSGAFVVVTILTDVAVGAHHLMLKELGSTLYFDTDYGFNVSDGSATLAVPDGFGPSYAVQAAPFHSNSRIEGGFVGFNGVGYDSSLAYACRNVDASIKFRTDAAQIRGWCYNSAGTFVVLQDGVQIVSGGSFSGVSALFNLVTFAAGLDTSAVHEYEIRIVNFDGGYAFLLTHIMLVGGTGLATTTYAARDRYLILGDSITQADLGTNDSRVGYVYKFGQEARIDAINAGVAGRTSGDVLFNIANYTAFAPTSLKAWFMMIGTNDISGSVLLSTFQSNVTGIVNALKAQYPTAVGNLIKILPRGDGANSLVPTYNAILADVAASTSVNMIDISTGPGGVLSTVSGVDLQDTVHPNATGYDLLAANLEAIVFPAGSGSSGAPYNSLTIGIRMDL